MHNKLTVETVNPEQKVVGYIVNSGLSKHAQMAVRQIQDKISEAFPGAIWAAPAESLHITLMDWLAPLVDYGEDKDELFDSIKTEYIEILADILKEQPAICITFDTIEVHPGAIIVKGRDDGSYQRIREDFLEKVTLLPNTKRPPQIVHSTICKFIKDIKLDDVKNTLKNESIYFEEEIAEFRLARESQIFMQQYEVLYKFRLGQ